MKKTLLFILMLCLSRVLLAQGPTSSFNTHHGSEPLASNSPGNYDAILRKVPDSVNRALKTERELQVGQTGFRAQETDDSIKNKNHGFNGVLFPQNANEAYSIRYSEFVSSLVKAVQELTAVVAEQGKEIVDLKTQLEASQKNDRMQTMAKGTLGVLYQNHSNPSSTETGIEIILPENTVNANLIFYTLEGKQLKILHLYNRGAFTVTVDSNDLTRGTCFYALMIEGKIIDSKQLLVRK